MIAQLFWEQQGWDRTQLFSTEMWTTSLSKRIQRCSHPCISSWGCPRWRPRWSCWAAPCRPLHCVWHCGSASGSGSAPGSPATKHTQCAIVIWLRNDTMRRRGQIENLTSASHKWMKACLEVVFYYTAETTGHDESQGSSSATLKKCLVRFSEVLSVIYPSVTSLIHILTVWFVPTLLFLF